MANAIGPARAFFVRSNELLAKYSRPALVVLLLQDSDNLSREWRNFPIQAPVLIQYLISARMRNDVGKLKVPKEILDKPGRLTEEEMAHSTV